MTRTELLELAVLDSFGLLDEYESALYTRSFLNAPATVREEAYALQAQLAADESLLPDEQPPDELRRRVLEYVAAAIERESRANAPLATIGASLQRNQELAEPLSEPAERHRASGMAHRYFWRAATFVLAVTVVFVSLNWSEAVERGNHVSMLALYDKTAAELEDLIGPTAKDFLFDATTQKIVLTAQDAECDCRAAVLISERASEGILVIEGLPWGEGYELAMRDSAGELHVVMDFESLERLGGVQFTLADAVAPLAAGGRWEIRHDGRTLLASA